MTTTSTSRYIHVNSALYTCPIPGVERPASLWSSWSTIEAPNFDHLSMSMTACSNHPTHCPRKLHKKRPSRGCSNITDSRSSDSSTAPTQVAADSTGSMRSKSKLGIASSIVQRIPACSFPLHIRRRSMREEERWVIVDITQVIKQRLV